MCEENVNLDQFTIKTLEDSIYRAQTLIVDNVSLGGGRGAAHYIVAQRYRFVWIFLLLIIDCIN